MKFIKRPNLPSKSVKAVVCDSRVEGAITTELERLGVISIKVNCDNKLQKPICAHPDIHIFHCGENNFITSTFYYEQFNREMETIDCEIFNNRQENNQLEGEYPKDVLLNGVTVGEYLICNKNTLSEKILDCTNKKIIHTNQGYTKCSVSVVSSDAIITDDESIYKSAGNALDVLYIPHGDVKLDGYNYGFIGGASGKLSNDILAFYGDFKMLSQADSIKSFCLNHGVHCISLSDGCVYDYGSLIPILE